MSQFTDNFDQPSIDARWTVRGATLDDENDRVDMSTGALGSAGGLISTAEFDALDLTISIEQTGTYQNFFTYICSGGGDNSEGARIHVRRQTLGGGLDDVYLFFHDGQGFASAAHAANLDLSVQPWDLRIVRTAAGLWTLYNGATVLLSDIAEPEEITNLANPNMGLHFGQNPNTWLHSVRNVQANVDPQLDTQIPDVSIPENSTTPIDFSGNFSDANNDTLTYAQTGLPAGFGFNVNTCVITPDGASPQGTYTVTITADDGQGGTPAEDTFTLTITAAAPILSSVSAVRLGETLTITTDGSVDLTQYTTLTATLGGVDCGAASNVTATTVDFAVPAGLELLASHNLILTGDGATSNTLGATLQPPTGKQAITLTSVHPQSVCNDYAGDGSDAIGAGDQWVVDQVTSGGLTINITDNGLFSFVDGAGAGSQTFDWFYLEAQDSYQQSGTQTVTANQSSGDTTPPVIALIGDNPLEWDQGTAWVDPGAYVTDDTDATVQISADNAPNINSVGQYILNYNHSDSAGNAAVQVQRTVNVVAVAATVAPTIATPGGTSLSIQQGDTYNDPAWTWSDDVVSGQAVNWSGNVDANTPGTYTRTATATNSVGTTVQNLTITVNAVAATVAPTIATPGGTSLSIQQGDTYNDPAWTWSDDVVSGQAVNWSGNVDANTPGVYTRTATATNSVGTTTRDYTVTVEDAAAPTITNPGTLTVLVPADQTTVTPSHPSIMAWINQWVATDAQGANVEPVVSVPRSMKVSQSPIVVSVTAVDSEDRVATASGQINLQHLSAASSDALIVLGDPNRYEHRGGRYYEVDD